MTVQTKHLTSKLFLHHPQKMNGHLRLLNMASAVKAKLRQVMLQKVNRDSTLPFSLLGGSERGFGIFIDNVKEDSKATETGLKRGDQVKWLLLECITEQQNKVLGILWPLSRRLCFRSSLLLFLVSWICFVFFSKLDCAKPTKPMV